MRTKYGLRPAGRIVYIPLLLLRPFPLRFRRCEDADREAALRDSVARLGILEPLTVCYGEGDVYYVIAGERRRKAAAALGLKEAPCILVDAAPAVCAVYALSGNVQRKELHYLEKAACLEQICASFHLSAEELAEMAGISLPELRRLTRYLAIPARLRRIMTEKDLPEPFAALLLHHADDAEKQKLLEQITGEDLTLQQAQARSAAILKGNDTPRQKTKKYYRDLTVFLNTLDHTVDAMREGGVDAACEKTETGSEIEYRIRIPKIKTG